MVVPLVAVASKNPVKLAAAESLLTYGDFMFQPVNVASGVPAQPMGDEQTLTGAIIRANAALAAVPGAQYGLGLEGGVRDARPFLAEFAYCVIVDNHGRLGRAKSAEFLGPPAIRAAVIEDGLELGHAMDRVYAQENSKQKGGASGILTDGRIERAELYRHAVLFAWVPFLREAEYWPRPQ